MEDEWWGERAIEASTSLVNRMYEAVSGRQWDTFNGGRSGKLNTANDVGKLQKLLDQVLAELTKLNSTTTSGWLLCKFAESAGQNSVVAELLTCTR